MDILIVALLALIQIEIIIFFISRKQSFASTRREPATYIDTSSLMDGRIMAAVSSGFIPRRLIIPRSVLAELQLLADGADSEKRTKARHGLDIAMELSSDNNLTVEILDDGAAEKGVDEQLLKLARKNQGAICTVDYNLAKVADVEQIPVLNINELAKQLRMNYLPGEKVSLKIVQKGNDKEKRQGVGYLADGTMVVVEQAGGDIDKTIEVEFIRSLQTAAGRMMFAKKMTQKEKSSSNTAAKKQQGRTRRSTKRANAEDVLVDLANR